MITEMKTLLEKLLTLLLLTGMALPAFCQTAGPEPVRDSVLYNGQYRVHYLYMPSRLRAERPLVLLLHGYGGKARGYRPEMLEVAEREGFALCIPQGLKAPEGKTGWYVGYPRQKGMKQDDDEFLCYLSRYLRRQYQLGTAFLTGMSNGGEMCYLIGRRYPGEFGAIASVAGLTMRWVADHVAFHGPVPFMEVHGTADRTSRWEGDPEGEGGWGPYLPVPEAVEAWVKENGCEPEASVTALPLKGENTRQVLLHTWDGGLPAWEGGPSCQVLLYEVREGRHSWALSDMDTCSLIWAFFLKYLPPSEAVAEPQ